MPRICLALTVILTLATPTVLAQMVYYDFGSGGAAKPLIAAIAKLGKDYESVRAD